MNIRSCVLTLVEKATDKVELSIVTSQSDVA